MTIHTTGWVFAGALTVLSAVAGCSGAGGGEQTGSTTNAVAAVDPVAAPVVAPAVATPAVAAPTLAAPAAASNHYTQLLARFDKNTDGILQVSELPPRMQKWLGDADTDHDGAISLTELQTHGAAMREKMFVRADKNGDGKIVESEIPAEHWEHLKLADANGDGAVTREEIAQAFASGKFGEPGDHEHHAWSPEKMFARFDKAGTGVIEISTLPEHIQKHAIAADGNQDGKLTLDELKTHIAERQAAHAAGHDDFAAPGVEE